MILMVVLLSVFVLVLFVLVLLEVIKGETQDDDFLGVYECGFDAVYEARLWFSYRFFLLGILFIVFDVEVSLLLSVPYVELCDLSLLLIAVFVLVLLGGTVYEVEMGSMDWV